VKWSAGILVVAPTHGGFGGKLTPSGGFDLGGLNTTEPGCTRPTGGTAILAT
jgi:hypothetical protein